MDRHLQGFSERRLPRSFLVTDLPHRKPCHEWRHSSHQMNRVLTIPASKLITSIFPGTVQKNLNAYGVFTTNAAAPPKYDNTQTGPAHHRAQRRGGKEDKYKPLQILPFLLFHTRIKGILQSRFLKDVPVLPGTVSNVIQR